MANIFLPVTAPAGNGSGAAVDLSGFSEGKTIIVSGSWTLVPTINVEVNNDPSSAAGGWQSIYTTQGSGTTTLQVCCRWVRVTVSNFRGGMAPVVNIGGDDSGTTFAQLIATAGNGVGAAVDVSALPDLKSVQVSDQFKGTTIIETSNDGGVTWGQEMSFQTPGLTTRIFAADFMRVRRSGVPTISPGLPVINVGACGSGSGGGVTTASNVGAGAGVFKAKVASDLEFKSLVAGANVILTPGANDITIASIDTGEVNTASNVGPGAGVFAAKIGSDLAFKSLVAGVNVTLTPSIDSITITSTDTGEVNTASNVGAGAGVFKNKVGSDLAFKSLVAGANITLTPGTDDITIASDGFEFTGLGWFGDGNDGAQVFDGTTTILGIAPTVPAAAGVSNSPPFAATKAYALVRDIYCTDMTVDSGVWVYTNGFRVFVTGTLTLNGVIACSGLNGGDASGTTPGTSSTAGVTTNIVANRTAGGQPTTGNGGNAGNLSVNPRSFSNTGGVGGNGTTKVAPTDGGSGHGGGGGYEGGTGATTSGGVGGQVAALAAAQGDLSNIMQAVTGAVLNSNTKVNGGSGGGGGGGILARNTAGGGSGGGGGCVVLCARKVTGAGLVSAQGGNGANGSGTGAPLGGGGGGGGGGIVVVVLGTGAFPTCTVAGGTGGLGGGGGANPAPNGAAGGVGAIYQFRVGTA